MTSILPAADTAADTAAGRLHATSVVVDRVVVDRDEADRVVVDRVVADRVVVDRDEADRVVVDRDEAELAARLRLAVTRLHRRLRQQADGGLTPSQASALAGVELLGSPTLGALAVRESVQPPSMTRIVGALEEMGHVSRVVDSSDRRVVRITITPAGEAVLRHIRSLKNAFLADRLHGFDPADRAALDDLAALLERLVDGDES